MKIFWPHRSEVNGFSIQNLASKYRLKISSKNSDENSNRSLENKNSKLIKNNFKDSPVINLSNKRKHWANRDFSEYKEVA